MLCTTSTCAAELACSASGSCAAALHTINGVYGSAASLEPSDLSRAGLQELLEAEMENKKSIEEEIEEDRRKVEARTPITLQARLRLACGCHSKAHPYLSCMCRLSAPAYHWL